MARIEAARHERSDPPRWDFTTTRNAADAWELNRLSTGNLARATRLIADRHWHLGNKLKGSKDVDNALEETVCQVCVEEHESQFHWVCRCNHKTLVGIREKTYARIDELLSMATPSECDGQNR